MKKPPPLPGEGKAVLIKEKTSIEYLNDTDVMVRYAGSETTKN
jgi:hypothetical protein